MTTDPTRAQADEAPRQRANREAERLAQQLEQAAALLRHLGAMHGGLAADAQPLEAKVDERDQALQFLAGLHTELTIDGPPMAVAERIWDAVMSEREALAEQIKNMERNLENFRRHFARIGSPPAQSEGSRG